MGKQNFGWNRPGYFYTVLRCKIPLPMNAKFLSQRNAMSLIAGKHAITKDLSEQDFEFGTDYISLSNIVSRVLEISI